MAILSKFMLSKMKQYTNKIQTARLIELGFEKPRYATMFWRDNKEVTEINYILGELLSFLPKEIDYNGFKSTLYIFVNQGVWGVEYSDFLGELYSTYRSELLDAIFDMCVKLKEEGLI